MLRTIGIALFLIASVSLAAQDCLKYYPQETDGSFEITTYDKKDRVEGRAEYTVVEKTADGVTYDATLYDKKDEELGSMQFGIYCEGDKLKVDMKNFMPTSTIEQMSSIEGMEVEMESEDMAFPNNMQVGDELPDANFSMKATVNGMPVLTTTSVTTNRKVIGQESVTTPLGTFNCLVITGETNLKMGFVKSAVSEKLYLHPEKGFIKSETFDKKGKPDGYSVRTR